MSALKLVEIERPSEERWKNYHRKGGGSGEHSCIVCGRRLNPERIAAWVELDSHTGCLIPVGSPLSGGETSQGCFPVGSECVKRVPVEYRLKGAA